MMSNPTAAPSIEPATREDLDAIAALNVSAYEEFSHRMTTDGWQSMKGAVESVETRFDTSRFLVVRGAQGLLGSVAYCPAGAGNPAIFPPEWAAVLLLAVAPEGRGQGIGKRLTSACIDLARRDGAAVIGLFTSELMTQAQRVYESLGFVRESELAPRNGLRYFRYKLSLDPVTGLEETGQ
jgi:ribosomal protein S18 acetylase RimI-like enzyme